MRLRFVWCQVDDSKSTLLSIGNELTGMFGTTFGFHDFLTTTMIKVRFSPLLRLTCMMLSVTDRMAPDP